MPSVRLVVWLPVRGLLAREAVIGFPYACAMANKSGAAPSSLNLGWMNAAAPVSSLTRPGNRSCADAGST
jgi:hypothetical protein